MAWPVARYAAAELRHGSKEITKKHYIVKPHSLRTALTSRTARCQPDDTPARNTVTMAGPGQRSPAPTNA